MIPVLVGQVIVIILKRERDGKGANAVEIVMQYSKNFVSAIQNIYLRSLTPVLRKYMNVVEIQRFQKLSSIKIPLPAAFLRLGDQLELFCKFVRCAF